MLRPAENKTILQWCCEDEKRLDAKFERATKLFNLLSDYQESRKEVEGQVDEMTKML